MLARLEEVSASSQARGFITRPHVSPAINSTATDPPALDNSHQAARTFTCVRYAVLATPSCPRVGLFRNPIRSNVERELSLSLRLLLYHLHERQNERDLCI